MARSRRSALTPRMKGSQPGVYWRQRAASLVLIVLAACYGLAGCASEGEPSTTLSSCDPPCAPGVMCVTMNGQPTCNDIVPCGLSLCPRGAICVDAGTGACACPEGTMLNADTCAPITSGCTPACTNGEVCEAGVCRSECDPACAPGQFCEAGQCTPSDCVPPCPPEFVCKRGQCVASGACSPPCHQGEQCYNGRCVDEDVCVPACHATERCVAGQCLAEDVCVPLLGSLRGP